jgi:cellulose synthase (UDP-forming)
MPLDSSLAPGSPLTATPAVSARGRPVRRHPFARLLLWVLCLAAGAGTILLAALPVGRDASVAVSVAIVAVATVSSRFAERNWHSRTITVLLFAFITLRYVFWRVDGTLPPVSDVASFIPGVILMAAEFLVLVMFFLSLFSIVDPVHRQPVPLVGEPAAWPTVDVFIPSYNEDPGLLETTLAAAVSLDYPADRFRVFLLDDGGTDQKIAQADVKAASEACERRAQLQALCARLGCTYITRARNERAKAGNINNAFAQTNGELILILDADHVPTTDFLRNTVGFMQRDSRLFLVQTPHFFINPDPIEYNLRTFDRMPSENEMFYYSTLPGFDRWNAAYFCGSAAVLRRTALEEVGGIVGDTITEDCETSLELHSRGWKSVYLARPMIAGLQPETFASFIAQRSRWAQGMIQIFLLKNPWLRRGLSLPQKICYTNAMIYWFFWFWRPVFTLAPLCYAFFGLEICRVDLHDFLCFVLPHIFSSIFLAHLLHGRTRWPLFSELYEYIQSFHVGRAAISAILNPRKPTFKVTAKGEVQDRTRFSELAGPFLVFTPVLAAGLGMAVWSYIALPERRDAILPVLIWNLLSLLIAGAALAVVYERKRVRRQERRGFDRPGVMTLADGTEVPVVVADVSAGGLGLRLGRDWNPRLVKGDKVRVATADPIDGSTLSTQVQLHRIEPRLDEVSVGVGFAPADRDEVATVARLVFGNSAGWDAWIGRKRSNAPMLMLGFVYFFARTVPRAALAILAMIGLGARTLLGRAGGSGA